MKVMKLNGTYTELTEVEIEMPTAIYAARLVGIHVQEKNLSTDLIFEIVSKEFQSVVITGSLSHQGHERKRQLRTLVYALTSKVLDTKEMDALVIDSLVGKKLNILIAPFETSKEQSIAVTVPCVEAYYPLRKTEANKKHKL